MFSAFLTEEAAEKSLEKVITFMGGCIQRNHLAALYFSYVLWKRPWWHISYAAQNSVFSRYTTEARRAEDGNDIIKLFNWWEVINFSSFLFWKIQWNFQSCNEVAWLISEKYRQKLTENNKKWDFFLKTLSNSTLKYLFCNNRTYVRLNQKESFHSHVEHSNWY